MTSCILKNEFNRGRKARTERPTAQNYKWESAFSSFHSSQLFATKVVFFFEKQSFDHIAVRIKIKRPARYESSIFAHPPDTILPKWVPQAHFLVLGGCCPLIIYRTLYFHLLPTRGGGGGGEKSEKKRKNGKKNCYSCSDPKPLFTTFSVLSWKMVIFLGSGSLRN